MAKSWRSFNIYSILISVIYRYWNLTASPLCEFRLKNELTRWRKRRTSRNDRRESESINREEDDNQSDISRIVQDINQKPDWTILYKPLRLFRAIKRYHNCGLIGVIFIIACNLILTHFTIKSLLYMRWPEPTPEDLAYLDSIYYSPFFPYVKPVKQMANLTGVMIFYSLVIRILFLSRLIRRSVENESYYRKIWPTQITLGYLSIFHMTITEYYDLIKRGFQHAKEIIIDRRVRIEHCLCSKHERNFLRSLSRMHQRCYLNLIDFDSCLKGMDNYFINNRRYSDEDVHMPRSIHLVDLADIPIILLHSIIGGTILFIIMPTSIYDTWFMALAWKGNLRADKCNPNGSSNSNQVYNETQNYFLSISEALSSEHIACRWFGPNNMFKVLEDYIFVLAQLPVYLDCALLNYSSVILISRTKKLKINFEIILEQMKTMLPLENRFNSTTHISYSNIKQKSERFKTKFASDINEQVNYYLHLLTLLLEDLRDMQDEWGLVMNILVVSNIILISLSLSVINMSTRTYYELYFISTLIINCVSPLILCLLSGVLIESNMRKICYPISRLQVNDKNILDTSTMWHLLKVNERISDENQRSLLIFNHYALTPMSAVSALGWVLSLVLLFNRFYR